MLQFHAFVRKCSWYLTEFGCITKGKFHRCWETVSTDFISRPSRSAVFSLRLEYSWRSQKYCYKRNSVNGTRHGENGTWSFRKKSIAHHSVMVFWQFRRLLFFKCAKSLHWMFPTKSSYLLFIAFFPRPLVKCGKR